MAKHESRDSYQKTLSRWGEGHLAWQEGLFFENKQAPISRGVAMEMLLGSMKVIMNS